MNSRNNASKLDEIDAVFSALSHPARRHILLTLHFRGDQMTAGEIAGRFSCSWPTTTRHLNVLRESGLVAVKKDGRERIYILEKKKLQDTIGEWLCWFDRPANSQ